MGGGWYGYDADDYEPPDKRRCWLCLKSDVYICTKRKKKGEVLCNECLYTALTSPLVGASKTAKKWLGSRVTAEEVHTIVTNLAKELGRSPPSPVTDGIVFLFHHIHHLTGDEWDEHRVDHCCEGVYRVRHCGHKKHRINVKEVEILVRSVGGTGRLKFVEPCGAGWHVESGRWLRLPRQSKEKVV